MSTNQIVHPSSVNIPYPISGNKDVNSFKNWINQECFSMAVIQNPYL